MQRYLIRALKSIVMFFVFGTLIFLISYFLGRSSHPGLTFMDLIRQSDTTSIVIFFVAFGLVYPLIGFVKQKVYASKPFDDYKEEVIRMFAQVNFVLVSDENNKMVFHHKNALSRLLRLFYEDAIEVNYADSPILLGGLRRDTYRLARMVQYYIRNTEKEE